MSTLYLYTKHFSNVNNELSLFYNYLSPNYYNENVNSTNYNIYLKILQTFNENITLKKNITYDLFQQHLNKYIYKTLNQNINEYISILISKNKFVKELFKYKNFQYYTNSSNEILRLLSDNNNTSNSTFNISKNYKSFKTKFILDKKNKQKNNIKTENQDAIKDKLFKIYIIINGLKKLMFNQYNNLIKFQNFTFNQIFNHISQTFGTNHLNFYNKNFIYFKFKNNTLNYIDIFTTILNNPDMQDKIVLLFLKHSYIKYNEKIDEILEYEKYKNIVNSLFKKFFIEKEEDYDDDILNITPSQKKKILQKITPQLYSKYHKLLLEHFSTKFKDNLDYTYINLNGETITTKLEKIPITYINNISLNIDTKLKTNNSIIIQDSDIIHNIIPNTTDNDNDNKQLDPTTNSQITNEANHRLDMLISNQKKQDIDYINHTINFFKDNFDNEENLEQLLEAISFSNTPFLKTFNLKVLRIKQSNKQTQDINLINNILGEVGEGNNKGENKDHILTSDDDSFIISDYNILSPIYITNFKITLDKKVFIFKSLLHYIYYNQFLMLYKIYCKYTNNPEASIIPTYKFAYNLLFKNSKFNITEINKEILSNTDKFKSYNELQDDYYNLLNELKLFLFKYEINEKINNENIPYFNFIIYYSDPLHLVYSDKYDDYLGIGQYGNGKNMIGKFLNEYRENIDINHNHYDHTDVFLIMCDFNKNVYNWFNYKLKDFFNCIVYIASSLKINIIDLSLVHKIIKNLYPSYNKTNTHKLPTLQNFFNFSQNTIQSLSENYNYIIHNITDNAVEEIWNFLTNTIHTLFNFQQEIISNHDSYQTFISLYDKYNIEHILYYILSSSTFTDPSESIDSFINTKTNQLTPLEIQTSIQPLFLLFNKPIDCDNYLTILEEYNESLSFNIEKETKYINIIKSKLKLQQN
jgi:hypothetical protein